MYNLSVPSMGIDLELRREGDFYLMERFEALGYRKKHLASLNQCRLFLQVTLVVDIIVGSRD